MRKVHTASILAVLLLAVSGCHSNNASGSNPEQAASASTAPKEPVPGDVPRNVASTAAANPRGNDPQSKDTRPLLVCFGDSLTAGLGTDPGQSYPDYLQADLDKLHYQYRVDNEGISGNTTKDGVERLQDIVALHPELVVVEFGGNDGLRGLRIEDTRANLDRIVGTLKDAGIKVALAGITLPPDYGEDYIRQFDETYRLLAKKYRVPLLPFLLKNVYGVPGMLQEDHIHATAKGNAIVAQNVVPLVAPLLKK
jgi:acyl-CoA thioesterase-1